MERSSLVRVRETCVAFPEVVETRPRPRVLAQLVPRSETGDDAERFFVPPWMGRHGWIGVRQEPPPQHLYEWDELAELFEDAYRMTTPKRLIARLDDP